MVLAENAPGTRLCICGELAGALLIAIRSWVDPQVGRAPERHRVILAEYHPQSVHGVLAEFYCGVVIAQGGQIASKVVRDGERVT